MKAVYSFEVFEQTFTSQCTNQKTAIIWMLHLFMVEGPGIDSMLFFHNLKKKSDLCEIAAHLARF